MNASGSICAAVALLLAAPPSQPPSAPERQAAAPKAAAKAPNSAVEAPQAAANTPKSAAEAPTAIVGTDERKGEAFAHYDRGKRAFEAEDWVAAAVEFQLAHQLFVAAARDESGAAVDAKMMTWAHTSLSQSATAFSRAMMPVDAAEAFRSLLELFGRELDAARRTEVDKAIADLEERIGTALFEGLPARAELRVDGRLQPAEALAGPIRLSAGQHGLEVRAPYYKLFTASFNVVGRQRQVVAVRMELSALPARVRVEASAPKAEVTIDGAAVGAAPVERVVEPGDHTYKVVAESYLDAEGKFSATPGERTLVLAGLTPRRAPLGLRIEAGYAIAMNVRDDTPFNNEVGEGEPFVDGTALALGPWLTVFHQYARLYNLRFGLGFGYLARPLNAVSMRAVSMWCPDALTVGEGQSGAWCPVVLEYRYNFPTSPVGPFRSGEGSVRLGTRFERRFGSLFFSLGGGLTNESYTRSALVNLSLLVADLNIGFGLDL